MDAEQLAAIRARLYERAVPDYRDIAAVFNEIDRLKEENHALKGDNGTQKRGAS